MALSDLCRELLHSAGHSGKASHGDSFINQGASPEPDKHSAENRLDLISSILDSVMDGVAVADASGRLIFFNPAAERLLGIGLLPDMTPDQRAEKYGCYLTDGVSPYPSKDLPMARALRGENVMDTEVIIRNDKRKNNVWLSVNANPLKSTDGKLMGGVCVFRDITQHKRSEGELLKTQAFLHSIVENLPDMVFVKDAKELRFVLFNKAGEDLLGHSRKTMLGKNDYDFFPQEQADFFTAKDREVLEKGRMLDITEEPIRTRRQGIRYLHTKKIPIYDSQGEPCYLLGISEDVTDHKRAQEVLGDKIAELARSEAEREQLELFTQLVSHDLQAPLQKIIGFSELLEEHIKPTLDERGQHFLDKVKEGARRMCLLMDGLVDFATVVTRHDSFKPVDLNEIVRGVLLDLEMRVLRSNAQVTVEKPLPTIDADKTQMRELLYNLISNAIKFHPSERPPRVRVRGRVRQDGQVNLIVADNGIGFDMKQKERIFKPLERLCRREDFEGMGIGLAICQKIVFRHKGTIRVKSAPEKGTVFLVTLPKEQKSQ